MIVPMKKVSLIIRGEKKEETLKKLRKLGIIHMEISEGSGARLAELQEKITLLERAIFTLEGKKKAEQKDADITEALSIAAAILSLEEEIKSCQTQQIMLNAELDRLKNWGNVDPNSLRELEAKGISISFYEMPKSEYEALPDRVKIVKLEERKKTVKFLLYGSDSVLHDETAASLQSCRLLLPQMSTDQMRQKISELKDRTDAIEERIAAFICYAQSLKRAIKSLEKEIEFEIYATGMTDETLSSAGGDTVTVAYFKGYIEKDNLSRLKQAAKDNSWGLLVEEPSETDNVPTKLKNNKFVSLVYPLTDFLGTVPGYFEYDISSWFLAFILLFFGMIFGDGGYGLLICAAAAIPILRSIMGKKQISPTFLLVGLFGLSTVLWGTFTCTWFGLSAEQLPEWLKRLSIPVISNIYADKIWSLPWTSDGIGLTTAQNLQIFCFTLALIQLTVAHVKVAVWNRGSIKMLGDIGAILELFGIYYMVLSLVVNAEVFSFALTIGGICVGTAAVVLIGIGFVLSFIFSNYEGSIVKSILSSLTNIVSVLLGVVNVFSDIVSYIRLWAVGLAGAAISATVNELAGPLLGNFMFMILAIIILVFGHGLNMILNVLSVIVHGIRLNTLEFSSHLNMSWSGHKFKPFKEEME